MTSEEAEPIKPPSETMVFSSMEDVKAYTNPVEEAVEEPPPESLEDPVILPPQESAVSVAQREAEEAMERVSKLKSQRQDALRRYEQLAIEISEAEKTAAEAVGRFRAVKPRPPLPPVPSFKECLEMARKQRPDADDRETVQMAARLHATMSDGLARAGDGLIYDRPIPDIEGTEVRNVEDHEYNITEPKHERGQVKSYG